MPLKSVVKVSHISSLSDARYCSGMGVEMLGFRVVPGSEYYISPEIFQDIRGWISGPKIVAELYGISSPRDIAEAIKTYAPDYFELNLNEYRKFRMHLNLPCIVYTSVPSDIASDSLTGIGYVLADQSTRCADVSGIQLPVLLNINSLEKLKEKQAEACFQGYVLEAPAQSRPGITNYEQLGIILEALEEDAAS